LFRANLSRMPRTIARKSALNADDTQTRARKPKQERDALATDPRINLANSAVLLDIDGTLLDIAPTPHEVQVPDGLEAVLRQLSDRLGGALAFISGRSVADIDRIFAPLKLPAVGGHGAEIRTQSNGRSYRERSAPLDDKLKARFSEIARMGPGIIIEDKEYSLAIHYRLAPQLGGSIIRSVSAICQKWNCDTLDILPGKSVIEIKPRSFDKGTGLRELMSSAPFAGRQPIFIGDDVTDEAAFAVLPEFSGIGFSVGGIVPGASFNFDGPKDVRLWLSNLVGGARTESR
jgi:trehalose 6-phosphate phosphatase